MLAYDQAYFPNRVSSTYEEAIVKFYDTDLTDCDPSDSLWLLCSILFPECQSDTNTASPCQQQCVDIMDSCPDTFEDLIDSCDIFPTDQNQEGFCFLPEGGKFCYENTIVSQSNSNIMNSCPNKFD